MYIEMVMDTPKNRLYLAALRTSRRKVLFSAVVSDTFPKRVPRDHGPLSDHEIRLFQAEMKRRMQEYGKQGLVYRCDADFWHMDHGGPFDAMTWNPEPGDKS
jgi:hypothetical protein